MLNRFTPGRSFGSQLGFLSAILMAPLVLLAALFVRESWRDIGFVDRELQGVRLLSAIWPEFNATAAGAPEPRASRVAFDAVARDLNPRLGTAQESTRFGAARTPAAKAETGASLILAVADNSNLMLDTDLDTFYLMHATTVRLPALAQAGMKIVTAEAATRTSEERVARLAASAKEVQTSTAAAVSSLDRAIGRAPRETRQELAGRIAALDASAAALTNAARPLQDAAPARASQIAAAQQRLQREIDATWRASAAQLACLLRARRARLLARLWSSLAFVTIFAAAAAAAAGAIARRLAVRVRNLQEAMKRLTAGDLAVDIPYRGDQCEIGCIASGVEALKQASADKARLMRELETAYDTLQEHQSWLKLALAAARMGAWRRKLPAGTIELSPELGLMLGFEGGVQPSLEEIAALSVEPETVRRWMEEARQAAAGEIDELPLEEIVTPFRRIDTGEVRWAMLRREMIVDPVRHTRDIVGVAVDITERKHLMDELNHRVKNNLATVLSLAMQTAKSTEDLKGFMSAFTGRVKALSKINELVTRHGWGPVELKEVLSTALSSWLDAGVVFAPGSPAETMVGSRAAVSLCLVLHELAANAVAHGALGAGEGRVEIGWSEPAAGRCALRWVEQTAFTIPPQPGTGATLIERLITGDLGGTANLDYQPHGVAVTINFALLGATA